MRHPVVNLRPGPGFSPGLVFSQLCPEGWFRLSETDLCSHFLHLFLLCHISKAFSSPILLQTICMIDAIAIAQRGKASKRFTVRCILSLITRAMKIRTAMLCSTHTIMSTVRRKITQANKDGKTGTLIHC